MTDNDRKAFVALYAQLASAYRERVDAADVKVYFGVLEPLDVRAVGEAASHLAREGTTTGRFPTAPEWYQVAAHIEADTQVVEARRALMPPPEEIEADLARIRAARDRFVETCRRVGASSMADHFERLDVRHPATDPDRPVCDSCGDVGRIYDHEGRWGRRCECAEHNPVIRRRALQARAASLKSVRVRRAVELAPARASSLQPLLSG